MSSTAHHAPNARKSAARLYQRARPGTPYTVAAREAEWLVALAENTYLALSDFRGHQALLITGHAGIGKTTLMLKLAALWEQAGAEILTYGPDGGGAMQSPYKMVRKVHQLDPGKPGHRILLLDSGFVPDSDPATRPYGLGRMYLDNGDRWGPLPGVHVIATAQCGPQLLNTSGQDWRRNPANIRRSEWAWARMVHDEWGLTVGANIHLDGPGPGHLDIAALARPGADVQEFSPTSADPWRPCPR